MWIWSTLQVRGVPGWKEEPLSHRDRILLFRGRRGGGAPLVKMTTLQLGRKHVQQNTYAKFGLVSKLKLSRYSRLCSEETPCSRQKNVGWELEPSVRWFSRHKHPLRSDMKGEAVNLMWFTWGHQNWTATFHSCILYGSYNYWHDCCISLIKLRGKRMCLHFIFPLLLPEYIARYVVLNE